MSRKLPFKTVKLDLSKEKPKSFIEIQEPTIVYKKVYTENNRDAIATLLLPEGTILYTNDFNWHYTFRNWHYTFRKLRVSQAIVLDIRDLHSKESIKEAYSAVGSFSYTVDDFVFPRKKFCRFKVECASGIHCFATREEAESW